MSTPKKTKEVKVKAWAVINTFDGWILEVAPVSRRPRKDQLKIISRLYKIVPCTISYQLSTKK